jgi:hypothetical protein
MNAITTSQDARPSTGLVPRNMDEAIRLAEFMARARTVPRHLWDSPGDCLMVVELAMRWGMSPFAVAQATSVISGKQMIEGKLVAAAVENSGAIVGHIDYDFDGEGDGRSITVTATRRGETNPRTVTVKLADAKTANQMWVKQPDQQLVYHGARVWARRWTPAVILGVYSREEMGPIIEGEVVAEDDDGEAMRQQAASPFMPAPPQQGINQFPDQQGRQGINRAAASDIKRADKISDKSKVYETPPPDAPRRTVGQLLDGIAIALRDATSRVEVDRILDTENVLRLRTSYPADSPVTLRLDAMRADALERHLPTADDPDEALEDLEIVGESKVMSG